MIKRLATLMSVVVGLLVASPALAQDPEVQAAEQAPVVEQAPVIERAPQDVVRAQLQAFNEHDANALVANLHRGFTRFHFDPDGTAVEMQGRGSFFDAMQNYFSGVPGAHGEIEELLVAGNFVTVRERAYWLQGGEEMSQASLAVYEIRDELIYRVWYYPAFE